MNVEILNQNLKESEDFEKALEIYILILNEHNNNIEALIGKAECLFEIGDQFDLLKTCDIIFTIDPNNINILNIAGITLSDMQEFDEAVKCYDKIICINPNIAGTWSNKANCLHALKKLDEALFCCNKALELDPNLSKAKDIKSRIEYDFK